MERVVVATSSSGIDYIEKPDNVRILRLHIDIEDEHYLDGKDITYQQITKKMMQNPDVLPTTSPASIQEIEAFFENLYQEGVREAFVVTLSSWMSKTYQNIMTAKSAMLGRMFIHVFDSKTIAFPEAWQVLAVSKMLKQGKNAIEIGDKLDQIRSNMKFWVVVEDLRNLIKTKRLSAPTGMIANMMSIKPIISTGEEGDIITIAKVRKTANALKQMCRLAADTINDEDGNIFIISTGYNDWIDLIKNELEEYGFNNIPIVPAASVSIAVHGPYALGLGVILQC